MTSRRYALRDDQWERIKDLLPGRAIATRYDKLKVNFLGAIYLAATVVWLN
jgi:transposase